MKPLVLISLNLLLLGFRAEAATYTVKAGGGGNFTTIQACANAAVAGDTCTVFVGTYNEVVTVPAGTAGNYKTLTVNSGDTVNVYGFVINSHTKVNGFHITRPSAPASNNCVDVASNATDWYITNNVMYACGSRAMINEQTDSASTGHGYIQGNKLSYSCSTSAAPNVCEGMWINGDYHLVENNDISHVSDGITNFGVHNVFRGNTFHDANANDCGSNSSNCHIDFIESEPVVSGGLTRPTQYNLYESNIIRNNLGANGHAFLTQADACGGQCFGVIIRFNNMAHVGTFGIIDDNSGSTGVPGFSAIKSYNNTWVDFDMGGGQIAVLGFQNGSTGGSSINNIFYFPSSVSNMSPYYVDSSSNAGFTAGSNLAWCTGTCGFLNRTNGGSFATDGPGNVVANPLFLNYSANNFALSTGSPAMGHGTSLTAVAAGDSGSGTSLIVNDARFFQDGDGITGVQADWIRIGSSTTVQISSINYSTNVITLASPVTRSDGDRVYLYRDSNGTLVLANANPDIGAYSASSGGGTQAPAAPTGLTAVVS
jgi:hypothetical protein